MSIRHVGRYDAERRSRQRLSKYCYMDADPNKPAPTSLPACLLPLSAPLLTSFCASLKAGYILRRLTPRNPLAGLLSRVHPIEDREETPG